MSHQEIATFLYSLPSGVTSLRMDGTVYAKSPETGKWQDTTSTKPGTTNVLLYTVFEDPNPSFQFIDLYKIPLGVSTFTHNGELYERFDNLWVTNGRKVGPFNRRSGRSTVAQMKERRSVWTHNDTGEIFQTQNPVIGNYPHLALLWAECICGGDSASVESMEFKVEKRYRGMFASIIAFDENGDGMVFMSDRG